ncbi:hypothetical protein PENTCL1PPCAC_26329, partial [Pristionchus entomophagus]
SVMAVSHVKGDLFEIAGGPDYEDWAIAHCISEDCGMGKGIAVEFKKRYGQVSDLKDQVKNGKKKGSAAYLQADGRIIFYMITKERYFHKPTYDTMEGAIKDMVSIMVKGGIKGCIMPRIGCGLDQLEWQKVEKLLVTHFGAASLSALVCSL